MGEDLHVLPTVTRRGKIGRLPAALREELNRRLRDGEQGPTILPWLASEPRVRTILERDFAGAEISPQNLSEWRAGGYAEWLRQAERIEHVKRLSAYSLQLAGAAGGSLSEGAIAVAGGKILELLESVADGQLPVDDEEGGGPDLKKLADALVAIRHTEIATQKLGLEREKLGQKDRQMSLDREKFALHKARMKEQIELLQKNLGSPDAPARLGKLVEMIDAL